MTNAPAGWHPDPEDPSQLRYWDGGAWTEHRAPATSGSPTPGFSGTAQSSGKATTSLVLGIVSLVTCLGPITGIPAMILGKQAGREIDASGGQLEGRGLATGGFVTGLIATILGVLALLLVVGVFAFGSAVQDSFEQSCQSTYPSPGPITEDC